MVNFFQLNILNLDLYGKQALNLHKKLIIIVKTQCRLTFYAHVTYGLASQYYVDTWELTWSNTLIISVACVMSCEQKISVNIVKVENLVKYK